ncbi:MAG: hypothetical protein ACRBCJ_11180 [Hyphomicrobiaceae bacterium]
MTKDMPSSDSHREARQQIKNDNDSIIARFLDIAVKIKAEAGIKNHVIPHDLSGYACLKTATVVAQQPGSRIQLYVLVHECAHIALQHNGTKPHHVEEIEAQKWAYAALRRHGMRVTRQMKCSAQSYVDYKIKQGKAQEMINN